MREAVCRDWPELERECRELFWEDFVYMSNLRCVTSLGNSRIYQHSDDCSKICSDCYLILSPAAQLRYERLYTHHLVHIDSVRNHTRCAICHRMTVMVKAVECCQDCLRKFDHADRAFLNAGNGIPVVTTLSQARELCECCTTNGRRGV
jgi:hypothetical protein